MKRCLGRERQLRWLYILFVDGLLSSLYSDIGNTVSRGVILDRLGGDVPLFTSARAFSWR